MRTLRLGPSRLPMHNPAACPSTRETLKLPTGFACGGFYAAATRIADLKPAFVHRRSQRYAISERETADFCYSDIVEWNHHAQELDSKPGIDCRQAS